MDRPLSTSVTNSSPKATCTKEVEAGEGKSSASQFEALSNSKAGPFTTPDYESYVSPSKI